jgi:hypothetical protein
MPGNTFSEYSTDLSMCLIIARSIRGTADDIISVDKHLYNNFDLGGKRLICQNEFKENR